MMKLHKNYRPGLVLVCPLCCKTGEGEPVQQLTDKGGILYCHKCGVLPFVHAWPEEWSQSWVQFGVIPGDTEWVKWGNDPSSTNGFPIVIPVKASEKIGRDREGLIKHLPQVFSS